MLFDGDNEIFKLIFTIRDREDVRSINFLVTTFLIFAVQVSSEGSVPANDGKSNSRYVSCSKPSLHNHKAPLGAGAI